ncbi:hypothetical protein Y09_1357 [Brachybacterium sp. SW0106-09]|uniref:hypothetical protein n=1 Tax=Brachybacterium sp. SW0106-09 TaxID=1704590 RepID=UPI0006B4D443|nr:hypothetical protein [Brachybacterium sp. SW0106-09]GAP78528.1 hypothetical protein Y09_1357 [Brachybacterium sp. SW0106-09]
MTTDNFTEATRAEAERRYIENDPDYPDRETAIARTAAFAVGAVWARTHLAAQEPTDGEVLAALNAQGVVVSPKMHPAPSLDYWGDKPAEAMRAALSAARAARRDEGKR